jgi:hypothetical protein
MFSMQLLYRQEYCHRKEFNSDLERVDFCTAGLLQNDSLQHFVSAPLADGLALTERTMCRN